MSNSKGNRPLSLIRALLVCFSVPPNRGGVARREGAPAMVGLVADRDVELVEAALNGVPQELMPVRAAGSEARDLAVVVARLHRIIAMAKREPQIGGGGGRADIKTAYAGERAHVSTKHVPRLGAKRTSGVSGGGGRGFSLCSNPGLSPSSRPTPALSRGST